MTNHVVLWDRLAFQRYKLDKEGNPTLEPDGPEEIVFRGHPVPDYMPDWKRDALKQSGMIVEVADVPQPVAVPEPLGPPAPDEPPVPEVPAPNATRGDWEAFATSEAVGMSKEEAESYPNKQALMDAVNAKLAEK